MENQRPLLRNRLTWKITSFSVDKANLNKLFQVLRERSYDAGEIEVTNYKQKDLSPAECEHNIKIIRGGFELNITITSIDGQELWGRVNDIFNSPNFPDQIKSIYVNTEISLKTIHNYYPRNSFELFLDFSKPELFNLSLLPSQETPNESNIVVQGYDATWVHGLFNEFTNFIKKYPVKITWLHKHSRYDMLLWIIGFPFSFWITYKLSDIINEIFGNFSIFVQNASYLYVFLSSLMIFRLLFQYARWAWPRVEYDSPKNTAKKHRIILGAITLGLFVNFVYDILKAIL